MKALLAIGFTWMVLGALVGGCAHGGGPAGAGNEGDGAGSGAPGIGGGGGHAPGGGGGATPPVAPPGALAVWTASAGRKIQPSTAPEPSSALEVETYRDAWVAAQIVVRGAGGPLHGVRARVVSELADSAGHTLPRDAISLFREWFVDFSTLPANIAVGNAPAPKRSPTGDGRVPDPLIPLVDPYTGKDAGQPFDVPQESNQPLFVDVHVPRGLAAGTYTGEVRVDSPDGSADVPIAVTVWGLDLPDMRSVATHFHLTINRLYDFHGGIADCSRGAGECYLDSHRPETRALVRRYEDLAHAHRIGTGQALVHPPVHGCDPPTDAEWAAYDAAMEPYMDGRYFTDGVPSGQFDVPFSPGNDYGVDGDCGKDEYQALSNAWASHLSSRGWFPQPDGGGFGAVAYAYDEPLAASSDPGDVQTILDRIVERSSWLQEGGPSGAAGAPAWKAHVIDTVSPIPAPADPATTPLLDPALGVYVVPLTEYGTSWERPFFGREQWRESPGLFEEGTQLWFYESNAVDPPYPTFATDTLDALEPVIMMWGSWFEKATGFLYWDVSYWADTQGAAAHDPWGFEADMGKTGDGALIYPGGHDGEKAPAGSPAGVAIDGPIPSYRLKMIRQGLQDWALFREADRLGLTSFVEQQVSTVYSQLGGTERAPAGHPYWTTDERAMAAVRKAVVAKMLSP